MIKQREEWRAIAGYEEIYEVSSLGRVRSLGRWITNSRGIRQRYKGRTLRNSPNGRGYGQVTLCRPGSEDNRMVHQLVMEAFIGPRPDGLEPNHADGDKQNNALTNLEYVTHSQNIQHAWDTGLIQRKDNKQPKMLDTMAES